MLIINTSTKTIYGNERGHLCWSLEAERQKSKDYCGDFFQSNCLHFRRSESGQQEQTVWDAKNQQPVAIIKLELSWWDKLRARDSPFPVAPLFWQTCLWKKSCETAVLEWQRGSTMPEHWTQHCQPKRIRNSYPLCVVCSVPFPCTWSDFWFFFLFFLSFFFLI